MLSRMFTTDIYIGENYFLSKRNARDFTFILCIFLETFHKRKTIKRY